MYNSRLQRHIKEIIYSHKAKSFDDLFKLSKGAFPEQVYDIVIKNRLSGTLRRKFYGLKEVSSIIPESNPSNYDWRFMPSTVKNIVNQIKEKQYKRIALFGTPSLFIPLSKIIQDITLYDINQPLEDRFNQDGRVVIADLNFYNFDTITPYDCIIMDPPWYLDYYKKWLEKGSAILRQHGNIYITLFQDLLRPMATDELKNIKEIANSIGPTEIREGDVEYITPLFEREIFNYKNIPCYGNWRTADLMIITKLREPIPIKHKRVVKDPWIRMEFGTQTIAIKRMSGGNVIKVAYPYKNNDSLLKSVSDRDKVRRKVNFITSRNRALVIKGNEKLIQVLKEMAGGVDKQVIYKKYKLSTTQVVEIEKILDTIFN